ncbi:glycosyltransferase [Pleomorphovibrio marinus]|uniref:glycosyltransferase n=1 Tax=Pleomorphovibrio marinus TaxID=2164132 RepID=UPI0018E54F1B|nr:glycosyltransferase [Pleomorphovibrio marinus]
MILFDWLWMIFFLALAIQLVYLLFVFGRLAFLYKPSEDTSDTAGVGVSVVIAARNELNNLQQLIPRLFEQVYDTFEVIIVNDRSSDGTEDFLREASTNHPNLRVVNIRYLPDHVTAKKYALTLGIKVAKHNVILLTDADCLPLSKNWIKRMSYPVRILEKDFALGHGSYQVLPGLLNKFIQYETLLTALYYFSFGLWRAPFMGVGRNLCYKKDFFMDKKAFKDLWHINGGDDDLFVNKYANKGNTAMVIHPESVTLSMPKENFRAYFEQKKRHFHVGKYFRTKDKLKFGVYTMSHLLFWLSGLGIILYSRDWEPIGLVLGLILLRAILHYSIFKNAKLKLEGMGQVLWTMFFDLLYMVYFWVIGTKGYLSKTVRWK